MAVQVENFKPLSDYLVILIPKLENKTKAGIMKSEKMIEQEMKEVPQVFEVVAVGDKVDTVNKGQYVLCTRINAVPVESGNEKFTVAVVKLFDVIGVTNSI